MWNDLQSRMVLGFLLLAIGVTLGWCYPLTPTWGNTLPMATDGNSAFVTLNASDKLRVEALPTGGIRLSVTKETPQYAVVYMPQNPQEGL